MPQIACSYAALRFLPYRETGEFANVGVIVWAPEAGYFGHRVNTQLGKRLRGFFPELDLRLYRQALKGSKDLLLGIEKQLSIKAMVGDIRLAELANRFHELVRAREGLLTFGPAGALLAENPETALETLHQRLVMRQFTKHPEYEETVMGKRLAECLRTWNLIEFYQKKVLIGDHHYQFTVPFAHLVEDRVIKILRPLDLDKKDPTAVFKHGDQWLDALRRLREFKTLPERVVIPVRMPANGDRLDAADRILRDFAHIGDQVQVIPIEDQERIRLAASVA